MKRKALTMVAVNGMLAVAALYAQPSVSPEALRNLRQRAGAHTSADLAGVEIGSYARRGLDTIRSARQAANQSQASASAGTTVIPLMENEPASR